MIRDYREKKWLRRLHLFLTEHERYMLEELATLEGDWESGRQGTGYFKLDLRELVDMGADDDEHDWLFELTMRALDEIGEYTGKDPELYDGWDVYLLYYPDGSEIPPHTDPTPTPEQKHVRLNAVVDAALEGGDLVLYSDREVKAFSVGAGDAIIFSPSDQTHAVDPIQGRRIVFSVGALVGR